MQQNETSMRQSRMRQGLANRPLLRLALLAVILFALMIALQIGAHALVAAVPVSSKFPVSLASRLLACVLMIIAYRSGVRLLEQRTASEIAFSRTAWILLPGAALGAAIFIIVYAILWAAGSANYDGFGQAQGALLAGAAALVAAVGEEIVFRGVVFRITEERFGTTVALIFSAAIFGLLHAANPGATILSTTAIALESGVLLAVCFAASRSLWLPIGIHFGWNFTEGSIFGAAVSGGKSTGLFMFSLKGSDLYTGGAFGPEASLVAVAICLVTSVTAIGWTIRLGRWRAFHIAAK